MDRIQESQLLKDLQKKMVFLAGPRQVGKTWLAKRVASHFHKSIYLNYDSFSDRSVLLKQSWPLDTELLVFDELHKYKEWKNYLKGLYDTKPDSLKILVTGSARLNIFKHGSDSLAGRYFLHHLLPFSLSEIETPKVKDMELLITRGGMPEPFLSDEESAKRWRLQYTDTMIKEDILEFKALQQIKAMQLILEILKRGVGPPVFYNSIAEDVQLNHNTVKTYIQLLEDLYIVFRVSPYSNNIARSLLKEPKIYFFDTGMVIGDEGAKFENFVAVSLYKHQLWLQDNKGIRTSLNYLRTKEKQEVDFCLVEEDRIKEILEAKLSFKKIAPSLQYFQKKHDLKAFQLSKNLVKEQVYGGITVKSAFDYLSGLRMG